MKRGAEILFQKCYSGIFNAMTIKIEKIKMNYPILFNILARHWINAQHHWTTFPSSRSSMLRFVTQWRMKEKKDKIEGLSRLHRQTTGNEVDLGMINSKWEDMNILLRSHDQLAQEQLEQLKASLVDRGKQFVARIDKFKTKWNSGKPKDERAIMDNPKEVKEFSDFVAEKHHEINELGVEFNEIQNQLEIFEKADIDSSFSNWALKNEFESYFGDYLNQEWLFCKSRIHEFQEKMISWADEKLKPGEDGLTVMQTRLRNKIQLYKDGIPALKLCRGDNFTTEHWIDLFRLTEIPRGTSIDNLTMGALLAASELLQPNLDEMKSINER